MKKLLGIIVLGLLSSNVGFSDEIKTNLLCKYENHYYRNWDQGEFGTTVINETRQDSITFTIMELENNYGFDTSYRTDWDWTVNAEYSHNVTETQYNFYYLLGTKYRTVRLNRFDGSLFFLTGYTNDNDKYQWKVSYSCQKAEQKF